MQNDLLKIINTYSSDGYYKHGNIPSKKLQEAMQNYPVDSRDTPLALIDSTVFGSAKTGMVIGLKGIYFKNDWTTKTEKNFISWDELSNSNSVIGDGAMGCILIIPGCEFNMSSSSMKKKLLTNLLNQIVSLYKEISNVKTQENMAQEQTQEQKILSDDALSISDISDSTKFDSYSELIPEIMAVCITADGDIENSEVELAIAIIENDELIKNKQAALESLSLNIDRLKIEKNKSNAIYKLKSTAIISKVLKVDDEHQKERLEIILEGMLESVHEKGVSETKIMIDSIRKKIRNNDSLTK